MDYKKVPDGFYNYLYLREDGTPYLAGKGTGRRAFNKVPNHFPPKDRSRILIMPMISEEEALEYETHLIALFGRKDNGTGCLHNLNEGGTGNNHPSVETRFKIGSAQRGKGHLRSAEWRHKQADANKGKVGVNTGRTLSDEWRHNIGEGIRKKRAEKFWSTKKKAA